MRVVLKGALAACVLGSAWSANAQNCDGCVVAAVTTTGLQITTAITAMDTSLQLLLRQIGGAINDNGAKVSSTIEAAAKAQREFDIAQQRARRREDARQRYYMPDSICSEAASGGSTQVVATAWAGQRGMRPGGSGTIAHAGIARAVNSPAQSQEVDAARGAAIHAEFCDRDDYAAYGGTDVCPAVNEAMPGADKRLDSVLIGAGVDAKAPDRTFSQAQTDVARMYTQNSIRRSVGPQMSRGEASSPAGIQYVGLMNQLNSILSAAAAPQDQRIAASQPAPVTTELLQETMKSPSARIFFEDYASNEARRLQQMSLREFESFEVGRRYSNIAYQQDLQAMGGDNLQREIARIGTLTNSLLLAIKDQLEQQNIISGQMLASNARSEFGPLLMERQRAVHGATGGQQ